VVPDQDVPDRPAHRLRLHGLVEPDDDPGHLRAPGQPLQQREQVLPQGAKHAAVGQFEHGQLVALAEPQAAADDAGVDLAQVVVDDGGARLRRAQQLGQRGVRAGGEPADEDERDAGVRGHCGSRNTDGVWCVE
jgi:hypothetical protein